MRRKTAITLGFIILASIIFIYIFAKSTSQKLIKLDFIKENLSETPLPNLIYQNAKDIIGENSLDGITQIFYSIVADSDEQIYSYLIINGRYYDLGKVSYDAIHLEDYFLYPTHITSENTVYKWMTLLGANYSRSNYIMIKNGIPYLIMSIDGNTSEQDIDNDGEIETVSTYGTAAETIIYEWDIANKGISFANLNKALNSLSVVFLSGKNQFEAYIQNIKGKYTSILYKYEKGMLYPEK